MNRRMLILALTAVLILILTACGSTTAPAATGGAETAVEESMPAASADMGSETMEDESHSDDMAAEAGMDTEADMDSEADMDGESHEGDMDGDSEGSMDAAGDGAEMDAGASMNDGAMRPAWQTVPLVNATTGEEFTLGGFAGQTVFVEPMATWCTNCRQQLNNVAQARASAGDDVVFVALSLETTLDPADLARYQQDNGFDWAFAVMSEELLQGLADEFGRSITSAPSTPHFIIRPDGSFTELSTGIDSPDELLEMLSAAGS